MKRFRLETLLKLRIAARDRRRTELAEAYQAEQILQRKQQLLEDQLNDLQQQSRQACRQGALNVDLLLALDRFQLVLLGQRDVLREQAKKVAQEVERRRTLLAEADQQVRVLEKLRERQHAAETQDEFRREMKQIDEFAQRCRQGMVIE